MELKFELKDEQNVNIIDEITRRIVGRVFTPSGTSRDKPDAIQICGFSRAFELWGCGVMGDNKGKPVQDIQLLFKDFPRNSRERLWKSDEGWGFNVKDIPVMNKDSCDRCFSWRNSLGICSCSELKVFKRYEDIAKWEKRKGLYDSKLKVAEKL